MRICEQRGAAARTGILLSKLEMLWAEVRELVATSSAARLSSGDAAPPAAGPQGTPVYSSTKGISNELVIARLRGKVDHLTKTLEAKEQALTQLQHQLQNQQHHQASAEDQARRDQVSRDLARANVQKKELEQSLSKSAAEAEEREAQAKQLTVRVQSLAAALQDKEAQAASLSALEKRVQELHLTLQELEPDLVPSQPATKHDVYSSLKALEYACERLSLGRRQTLQELSDAHAKLTSAGWLCVHVKAFVIISILLFFCRSLVCACKNLHGPCVADVVFCVNGFAWVCVLDAHFEACRPTHPKHEAGERWLLHHVLL